jgi:hypothetical protein
VKPTRSDRRDLKRDFGRSPTSDEIEAIAKLVRVIRVQSLMLVIEGVPLPESVRK